MKLIILILAITLTAGCVEPQIDFYSCSQDSDCINVGCGCHCSGCGGFSYDEIINKKYVNEWYQEHNCSPPQVCPMVCCPAMKIICEDNVCKAITLESPTQTTYLCKGAARCFNGTVTKITDGDTLEVNNISIRLALIDAPEYNEVGGNEAREFALSICPVGSTALVDEDDNQTGGSYGRTVGVVYCNENNINEELVENGFATIDERFCEVSEFADEDWTNC